MFLDVDKCLLPLDSGSPCPGFRPTGRMWYYHNSDTGNCETMMYNGCGGNANRFTSYYDCATQCQSRKHLSHVMMVLLMIIHTNWIVPKLEQNIC